MKYYKIETGPILGCYQKLQQKNREIHKVNHKVATELGAMGVNHWSALFEESMRPEKGWLFEWYDHENNGYVYSPDKRTKIGKNASKILKPCKDVLVWVDFCVQLSIDCKEDRDYYSFKNCDGNFFVDDILYLGVSDTFFDLTKHGAESIKVSEYLRAKAVCIEKDELQKEIEEMFDKVEPLSKEKLEELGKTNKQVMDSPKFKVAVEFDQIIHDLHTLIEKVEKLQKRAEK